VVVPYENAIGCGGDSQWREKKIGLSGAEEGQMPTFHPHFLHSFLLAGCKKSKKLPSPFFFLKALEI